MTAFKLYSTLLTLISFISITAVLSSPTHVSALSINGVTGAVGGLLGLNQSANQANPQKQPTAQTAQATSPSAPVSPPIKTTDRETRESSGAIAATLPPKDADEEGLSALPPKAPLAQAASVVQSSDQADTGTANERTATLQAERSIMPAVYETTKISAENRNQLLAVALSVVVTGAAIYAMTTITATGAQLIASRRPVYIK